MKDSKLEGTEVRSSDNQIVGDITGIGIGENGSLSFLLSLENGGDVAVNPGAMSLTHDESGGNWNARVNATASDITSAPQVGYAPK
jgi:hypothetical protein